jgi:hypothetical protein
MSAKFVMTMTIVQAAEHARLDEARRQGARRRRAAFVAPRQDVNPAPAKRRWRVPTTTKTKEVTQ